MDGAFGFAFMEALRVILMPQSMVLLYGTNIYTVHTQRVNFNE